MRANPLANGRGLRPAIAAMMSVFSFSLCCSVLAQDAPEAPTPPPALPQDKPAETKPQQTKPANLPAAKDLVAASIEAIGGKAAVDKINNVTVTITIPQPMGALTLDIKSDHEDRFLLQEGAGDFRMSAGSNGEVVWIRPPNATEPQQLKDDGQIEQIRDQVDLFAYWVLFNPKQEAVEMETVDQTEFAGEQCYKVHLISEDEKNPPAENAGPKAPKIFAMFSIEKKLMRGLMLLAMTPMGEMPVSIAFSDWKTIDDVQVYQSMTMDRMGQTMNISYSNVSFNTIDPSAFTLPADVVEMIEREKNPPPPTPPPSATPESPSNNPAAPKPPVQDPPKPQRH